MPEPESTEPEFTPVIKRYLGYLAAGDYDAAIGMTDIRGLANSMEQKRLAVLRARNPGMTPEEEAKILVGLREKELHRDNLKKILLNIIEELNPKGKVLKPVQAYESTAVRNGAIANCSIQAGDEEPGTFVVGLVKIGPDWYIAPYVVEESRAPRPAQPQLVPAPDGVVAIGDAFWGHWRSGAMDEAYVMATDHMRENVSLLQFLETSKIIIEQQGPVIGWDILGCVATGPNQYRVLYKLECGKRTIRALVQYAKIADTWQVAFLSVPYTGQ